MPTDNIYVIVKSAQGALLGINIFKRKLRITCRHVHIHVDLA